jgi:hypothetical protein
MKTVWQFSICYDSGNPPGPYSIGFRARSSEEVDLFGASINAAVSKNEISPDRLLRVELSEGDPRLQILLERIESTYGWKPSKWLAIPLEQRSRFFGVQKLREYSKKDLDIAPFLCLHADKPIATREDGTAEHVEAEVYIAEADRLQTAKTQFGALFPFHGLCVAEPLGRQLQAAGLKGLALDPVVFLPPDKVKKPLLKLSSTFIAPRSLLPLVNESGHQIEPNTEWACYLDDGGYHPHEFKYRTKELERFQEVDIAMSYERTGVTKARAYRWCIVSQRFRQVMGELKVPGVSYAPVRFVE